MKLKSNQPKATAEQVVKDIRRATRRHYSTEDKMKWTPKTGQQFKWDTVTRNGVNHDRDKKAQRTPAGAQSQGRA